MRVTKGMADDGRTRAHRRHSQSLRVRLARTAEGSALFSLAHRLRAGDHAVSTRKSVSYHYRCNVSRRWVLGLGRDEVGGAGVGKHPPPSYRLENGGEQEEQSKGFAELALVMQFRHAAEPLVVFAAIPYGIVGALAVLWAMNAPFGFMAFLGVASLVGVIVSHAIVLFDFIEEQHEAGAPQEQPLLDAGIMRLRPLLITVGATVIALFPLASHGGPLWEPLCFAQIGGLTAAAVVTLLMVPVTYAVFVEDLRLIR